MRLEPTGLDLSYCTNIHAGESWKDVEASLAQYAPPLKAALSPSGPFGLGLRLSAAAAKELRQGDALSRFRDFLNHNGLYVALINGFPYGSFHSEVVKEKVFAPDWRDSARLAYTLDLVEILQELLPVDMDGGISTTPLSYKPWMLADEAEPWSAIVGNLVPMVARMAEIHHTTGKLLHLDIEPEPNGLVESTPEVIHFFEGPLRNLGEPVLAKALGVTMQEAHVLMRTHVQVCFDTCHLAVEFEDPLRSLKELTDAGIGIGRIQVSSALRVQFDGSASTLQRMRQQLEDFTGSVYLHQVIERNQDGTLHRYRDLEEALALAQAGKPCEWRVHFHIPLFQESYGPLLSTYAMNRAVLQALGTPAITSHLEVETYTWGVLPEALRMDLGASIERELRWVQDELCTKP